MLDETTLRWKAGNFEATFEFAEGRHGLTLLDFRADQETAALDLATGTVAWLEKNLEAVEAFAGSALLDLKNDVWREEDEAPLTATEFTAKLSLEGVDAFSDGTFEVYFDDGDLFWGHSVRVDPRPRVRPRPGGDRRLTAHRASLPALAAERMGLAVPD